MFRAEEVYFSAPDLMLNNPAMTKKKYQATILPKKYLEPSLSAPSSTEVEAINILEAIAVILTQNELVDMPDIIKIELVDEQK